MIIVNVSPKYQVVIPKRILKALEIKPGDKVQVILYGDRIELIPLREIREMRGFLKGLDTQVEREGARV